MQNIRKLSYQEIPKTLKEIPDPPKELYIRGTLPNPYKNVFLTIVGSRKYTDYGKSACETIIQGLANYPVVIVSGLALGMDSIAHKIALEYGLKTVAIPGSGLSDRALYPASNLALANRILLNDGALISEYEPEFQATNWSFPRRNRLMAGISKATLIVEAGTKSGSLITAYLAVDYNRDVMAVPGSIFSQNSLGTNELIRDGAVPIISAKDVIRILGLDELENDVDPREIGNLSDDEKNILDNLEDGIQKDELGRKVEMPTQKINIVLTQLEMKGIIKIENGIIRSVF